MEGEVHRDDIRVSEALIRGFLFLVGIGGVVENLLQLPQVPRPRHHIEEIPAGLQNAAEFVNGQRGEAVQQNVCGPIREGQVIAGGHCKFDVLIPLGSQPQNEFGDVNACHAGRFPGSRQGLVDAGGVISLAASGV